jgi:tryptophan-rich sensory protein
MNVLSILFWYLLVYSVSLTQRLFFKKAGRKFYDALIKPTLTPSPFLIAILWVSVYTLQATASWWLLRSVEDAGGLWDTGLTLYLAFLGVSAFYVPLFFFYQNIFLAWMIILISLTLSIVTTYFYFVDSLVAGWLMLPTPVWIAFLTYLQSIIFLNNRAGAVAQQSLEFDTFDMIVAQTGTRGNTLTPAVAWQLMNLQDRWRPTPYPSAGRSVLDIDHL